MRWEGGIDRADLAVAAPPAKLAALSFTMSAILNLDETRPRLKTTNPTQL